MTDAARILQAMRPRAPTGNGRLLGEKANALITDPPYCILTRRRKGGELRGKKEKKIEPRPAAAVRERARIPATSPRSG